MCGSTRAVCALAAGDLNAAFSLNPVGIAVVLFSAVLLISSQTRSRVLDLGSLCSAKVGVSRSTFVLTLCIFLYAGMWVWNLNRW